MINARINARDFSWESTRIIYMVDWSDTRPPAYGPTMRTKHTTSIPLRCTVFYWWCRRSSDATLVPTDRIIEENMCGRSESDYKIEFVLPPHSNDSIHLTFVKRDNQIENDVIVHFSCEKNEVLSLFKKLKWFEIENLKFKDQKWNGFRLILMHQTTRQRRRRQSQYRTQQTGYACVEILRSPVCDQQVRRTTRSSINGGYADYVAVAGRANE